MKRSEMIALIQYTFEMEGTGTPMRTEDATAILDALEQAGMKPPENGLNYGYGEDYFETATPKHEWDEE